MNSHPLPVGRGLTTLSQMSQAVGYERLYLCFVIFTFTAPFHKAAQRDFNNTIQTCICMDSVDIGVGKLAFCDELSLTYNFIALFVHTVPNTIQRCFDLPPTYPSDDFQGEKIRKCVSNYKSWATVHNLKMNISMLTLQFADSQSMLIISTLWRNYWWQCFHLRFYVL